MFDSVGHEHDPGAAGRRFVAALLTAFLVCVVLGLSTLRLAEVIEPHPELIDGDLVFVDPPDVFEQVDELPPELSDGGSFDDTGMAVADDDWGGDTGWAEDEMDTGFAPDPEGDPTDPGALSDDVDPTQRDEGEGLGSGTGGGTGNGGHGSGGGTEPVAVEPEPVEVPVLTLDELPVRRKPRKPEYPPVAKRREMGVVTCTMHVSVDGEGQARQTRFVNCPIYFRAHARAYVLEWEFEHYQETGPMQWKWVEVDVLFEP